MKHSPAAGDLFGADPPGRDDDRTIAERFSAYHAANPDVWRMFVQYAREMKRCGWRVGSAKLIIERIRWERILDGPGDDPADYAPDTDDVAPGPDGPPRDDEPLPVRFKINNIFTRCYARKLMADHPEEFAGFFRKRRILRH